MFCPGTLYVMKSVKRRSRDPGLNVFECLAFLNADQGCVQKCNLLVIVLLWTPAPFGACRQVQGSRANNSLSLTLLGPVAQNVMKLLANMTKHFCLEIWQTDRNFLRKKM